MIEKRGTLEKRKGYTLAGQGNFGDEILAAGIFCACPTIEVERNGHPDLLVVHFHECSAFEKIKALLAQKGSDRSPAKGDAEMTEKENRNGI